MIVWNPANKTTIEARNTRVGVGHFSYANGPSHDIFEIWRVRNVAGHPVPQLTTVPGQAACVGGVQCFLPMRPRESSQSRLALSGSSA
jgi:hypothetical protein